MTRYMKMLSFLLGLSFLSMLQLAAVAAEDAILVGAGDIAQCPLPGAAATASLLKQIPGTVFTAGDNTYPDGATKEFKDCDDRTCCYDRTWGLYKDRTRPTPGNHDYNTPGAAPYYAYFGKKAGKSGRGYYSYNLQNWHIVALNSNLKEAEETAQERWLRADLKAHPTRCSLAYWHHPLFTSVPAHGKDHGNNPRIRPLWQILAKFRVDLVINGHEHNYERFAPQNLDGFADPAHGIREFVVGTGGAQHGPFGSGKPQPNSEVRDDTTWGVLKLTLHARSYEWEFIPASGGTFHDAGSAECTP